MPRLDLNKNWAVGGCQRGLLAKHHSSTQVRAAPWWGRLLSGDCGNCDESAPSGSGPLDPRLLFRVPRASENRRENLTGAAFRGPANVKTHPS
jgi:hypothetical protein